MLGKAPKELLKEATKFKKKGDFDSAINALKRSYKLMSRDNETIYSIKKFLRLPLYLQKAGRTKEAWEEFNNLLENGYPNQPKKKGLVYTDEANIYNKMRLYLQRENKNDEAIKYGTFSHLAGIKGLYYQKRKSPLKTAQSIERIQYFLKKLLKKANKLDYLDEFVDLVTEEAAKPSRIDLDNTSKRIDKLLSKANSA